MKFLIQASELWVKKVRIILKYSIAVPGRNKKISNLLKENSIPSNFQSKTQISSKFLLHAERISNKLQKHISKINFHFFKINLCLFQIEGINATLHKTLIKIASHKSYMQ